MSFGFTQIPNLLKVPGTYVEVEPGQMQGLPDVPEQILLIGQMLDSGSADPLTFRQITRKGQGFELFGAKSQLGAMCEAFRSANSFTPCVAIGVEDDDTAVHRIVNVTFEGTATGGGVLNFLVHGHRIPVSVSEGDDYEDVAENFEAAVNAHQYVAFTADTTTETDPDLAITALTCVHGGVFANSLRVYLNYYQGESDAAPPGITVTIADDTAGTVDADYSDVIPLIGDEWYTAIVSGSTATANLEALIAECTRRYDASIMQDCFVYGCWNGNWTAMESLISNPLDYNSQYLCRIAYEGLTVAPPTPAYQVASVVAAIRAREPDPARPIQTLQLPGVIAPKTGDRLTVPERDLLLKAGYSTIVYVGNNAHAERLVTSYLQNGSGLDDEYWRDLVVFLLIKAMRYTARAYMASRYPRHKLGDDGTDYGPNQPVMTPALGTAEALNIGKLWAQRAWLENYETFRETAQAVRNETDRNRLDMLLPPDLINQLRVIAIKLQPTL